MDVCAIGTLHIPTRGLFDQQFDPLATNFVTRGWLNTPLTCIAGARVNFPNAKQILNFMAKMADFMIKMLRFKD